MQTSLSGAAMLAAKAKARAKAQKRRTERILSTKYTDQTAERTDFLRGNFIERKSLI